MLLHSMTGPGFQVHFEGNEFLRQIFGQPPPALSGSMRKMSVRDLEEAVSLQELRGIEGPHVANAALIATLLLPPRTIQAVGAAGPLLPRQRGVFAIKWTVR